MDEQIRGGIVQGLGAALWEQCVYDRDGQMLNATMADYLVPMAAELPDMRCGHVVSPTSESDLGAKGAGEAGTCGAPAAVMNALNDALAPFAARLTDMPFTPQKVLRARQDLSRARGLLRQFDDVARLAAAEAGLAELGRAYLVPVPRRAAVAASSSEPSPETATA